jgi:hypothetical protein
LVLLLPIAGERTIEDMFREWYGVYPNKKAPKHALAAFEKALKGGAAFWSLMEGVRRYAEHCRRKGTEKRFIKHPATYLNGGCWADEYESPIAASTAAFARVGAARRVQRGL